MNIAKIAKFCKNRYRNINEVDGALNETSNFTKSAKIAKFCKNRYRYINEVEIGPSTKLRILRNLRKSRNFVKIVKEVLMSLQLFINGEGKRRNEFAEWHVA